MPSELSRQSYRRTEMLRFVRFCIVGASSFGVGFLVFNAVYWATGKLIFSSTMAYVISVGNGFLWNRRWTFKDRRGHTLSRQAGRFLIANIVGFCINIALNAAFLALADALRGPEFDSRVFRETFSAVLHGHARAYSFLLVNAAGIGSTAVVIVWNYVANRFWSFRK